MSDNLLFQTQSREIPSIALLADCTFSSKAIKECFQEFQDPKFLQETELNYFKEQNRRMVLELSKAGALNKDLQIEIARSERKLSQKDREIVELKSQCEIKSGTSRRLQEIDLNLPRLSNKASLDENVGAVKSLKSSTDYESTIKKLTVKNKSLKKELEKITEKLKKLEEEKGRESKKDYYHIFAQELSNKLKEVETTREGVEKENLQLKEKLEKVNVQNNDLRKESSYLKKNYDDLKERYESLELSMSSNKGDYSTESGANSETTVGSNATNSKRSRKRDVKWNLEGADFTIQGRDFGIDFGGEECKKIVQEIMEIYQIKNPMDIVPSIKKMEKVVHLVPKLRRVVSEVAAIVLPRTGHNQDKGEIELVVPSLKKLVKEIEQIGTLNLLKNRLIDVLQLEKECSNVEILKKVDKLAISCYQTTENREQNSDNFENSLLSVQFAKIFGAQPTTSVFRQISKQIEDFKCFISTIKHKLKLEADIKTEACLCQIVRNIENNLKDKQAAEITHKLQGLLNCSVDSIVNTIDKMIHEKRKREKTYVAHEF